MMSKSERIWPWLLLAFVLILTGAYLFGRGLGL